MEVLPCIPQFLKLYSDVVIFAGQNVITKNHSHHAVEIILSFDSMIALQVDENRIEAKALMIKPNVVHSTRAEGFMAFIFISPETTLGRRLNQILNNNKTVSIQSDILKLMQNYISNLIKLEGSESELLTFFTKILIEDVSQIQTTYRLDHRIEKVINHIKTSLHKPLDFKELKEIACLSESRLIHLFKAEIGIPIRKYVLWCRLQQAVSFVLKGHTLTQSAHLSGFSDAAHLTRTFSAMFGMCPSSVFKS